MSLERNTDLPENLRNGLNADQQTLVRGLFNTLVYEQDMNPDEASQVASKMLQTSGMVYDGKWNVVKSAAATGVITKVDEDKRLVFGWASIIKDTEGKVLLDRQNDFIDDEEELEKSAYTYVLHSRDGGEMHIRKGVSTMVESVVLTKEKQAALGIPEGTVPIGWWIGFKVNDDRVWDEVKKGGYVGFSVHGTGQRNETKLKPEEYTDVEKCDSDSNVEESKPALVVTKRYVELLTKAQKNRKNKIATVMSEFKAGKLKSSTGEKVTDPKQAMAIAISEQKKVKKVATPTLVMSLKNLLANTDSVYHEAHGFHWNVKGQDFAQYHELFGEIYKDLYSSIDPIAENILKLGADAPSRLSEMVALRTIEEYAPVSTPQAMATQLLECLVKLNAVLNMAFNAANEANEQGIANFIAERIDSTQKWMWQLRSSVGLQKGDYPGHPFRGNQHTGGKGGGKSGGWKSKSNKQGTMTTHSANVGGQTIKITEWKTTRHGSLRFHTSAGGKYSSHRSLDAAKKAATSRVSGKTSKPRVSPFDKGDKPNHPFRGNQHTSGKGKAGAGKKKGKTSFKDKVKSMSDSELQQAHAKAENAPGVTDGMSTARLKYNLLREEMVNRGINIPARNTTVRGLGGVGNPD